MKKSKKIKEKEEVATRKKLQLRYGLLVAGGIIIVAALWFVMFNPDVAKPVTRLPFIIPGHWMTVLFLTQM